jgi:hypothetical protein
MVRVEISENRAKMTFLCSPSFKKHTGLDVTSHVLKFIQFFPRSPDVIDAPFGQMFFMERN